MSAPPDYAKVFRLVRAARGWSQKDMAEWLGMNPSSVSLIEAGKRQPSHATLATFCEVAGLTRMCLEILATGSERDLDSVPNLGCAVALISLLFEEAERVKSS